MRMVLNGCVDSYTLTRLADFDCDADALKAFNVRIKETKL